MAPGPAGPSERICALVSAAHEASREGLVRSTSGNFSVRLDERHFAISRARSKLGELRPSDVIALPTNGGGPVTLLQLDPQGRPDAGDAGSAGLRPSRETPLHRALYAALPQLGSVLHFQSPAATALACRAEPLPNLSFIPEFPVYVRKVADVPYFLPGSEELASALVAAFVDPDVRVAQLRQHGQVVLGADPQEVVERAVFFELACELYWRDPKRPPRTFRPDERRQLESY